MITNQGSKESEELAKSLEDTIQTYPPLVKMAYFRYMTIVDRENLDHFFELKEQILEHGGKMDPFCGGQPVYWSSKLLHI